MADRFKFKRLQSDSVRLDGSAITEDAGVLSAIFADFSVGVAGGAKPASSLAQFSLQLDGGNRKKEIHLDLRGASIIGSGYAGLVVRSGRRIKDWCSGRKEANIELPIRLSTKTNEIKFSIEIFVRPNKAGDDCLIEVNTLDFIRVGRVGLSSRK